MLKSLKQWIDNVLCQCIKHLLIGMETFYYVVMTGQENKSHLEM